MLIIERFLNDNSGNDVERLVVYCSVSCLLLCYTLLHTFLKFYFVRQYNLGNRCYNKSTSTQVNLDLPSSKMFCSVNR
jgi:hypothetical protein